MASLLSAPAAPESGRISQLLPSVKCSNCNAPVPIHELGDHVCAKPATALSGFQRLQNMVSPARSDSPKIPGTRRSRTFSFGGKKTPVPTSSRPPMPANALALAVQQQKLEEQASVRPPPRTDSRDSYASSYRASKSPAPSTQHLPPIPFPGHGSTLSANPSRTRTGSTASSNSSRPSVDVSRNRTPSNASRPSADYTRARNISNATASSNGRPSYDSNTRARTPSDNSQFRPPLQSSPSNHSVLSVHSNHSDPTRSSTSPTNIPPVPQFIPPPQSTPTPPPSAPSHHHQPSFHQAEPDTKTGGEAGMAGVGRRGFQAAARAAYFTVPHQDTRRNHAPGLLDINRAVNGTSDFGSRSFFSNHNTAANTPPLSPSLSSAHSPLSPFSQNSPLSAVNYDSALPSGSSGSFEDMTTPRMDPNIAPSRTPSPPLRSPFSDGSIPLPNVEPFDQLLTPTKVILADYDGDRPLSPLSESDYGGGLAYADSSDDEDSNELDEPSKDTITSKIEFPSYSSRSKTESVSVYSPRLHARSFSAATSISDYTPRNNAKSTGALDNAMETLFEDDSSPSTSVVPLPNTMNHPFLASAPESPRGDLAHKLPVRSHTSPSTRISRTDLEVKKTARSATSGSVHGRTRTCASCDETIEDGKWIPMDGGGVLCDRCWKNMYLPKVR